MEDSQILDYMKEKMNKEHFDKFVYMFESGKRIRPEIMSSVCNHINKNFRPLFAAAAALEAMHCLSLAHDDVIDKSDERRGKSSFNKKFGINSAVLFGDFFAALAFQIFAENYPIKLHLEFIKTFKTMIEGQIMEMEGMVTDLDSYFDYVSKKTVSLFLLCAKIPLIYYDKEDSEVMRFMKEYGLIFQAINDINDGDKELGILNFMSEEKAKRFCREKIDVLKSFDLPQLEPVIHPLDKMIG